MPAWFSESRFDLNGKSTRELFLRAIKLVMAAQAFDRVNAPCRPQKDPIGELQAAIADIFRDKAAAVVFHETGRDRDRFLRAVDDRCFIRILAGLQAAIQIGNGRPLPVAEWLARLSIDAQKRYAEGEREIERFIASSSVIADFPEQGDDAERKFHAARQVVITGLEQGASREQVMENVDQMIDAARSYRQAT